MLYLNWFTSRFKNYLFQINLIFKARSVAFYQSKKVQSVNTLRTICDRWFLNRDSYSQPPALITAQPTIIRVLMLEFLVIYLIITFIFDSDDDRIVVRQLTASFWTILWTAATLSSTIRPTAPCPSTIMTTRRDRKRTSFRYCSRSYFSWEPSETDLWCWYSSGTGTWSTCRTYTYSVWRWATCWCCWAAYRSRPPSTRFVYPFVLTYYYY